MERHRRDMINVSDESDIDQSGIWEKRQVRKMEKIFLNLRGMVLLFKSVVWEEEVINSDVKLDRGR